MIGQDDVPMTPASCGHLKKDGVVRTLTQPPPSLLQGLGCENSAYGRLIH